MPNVPALRPNASRAPVTGLLAAIFLLAGFFPATAQSRSAAVVCVGSELQTLDSSSPVRRVITEDVAVIYRVGVRADDREGTEQSLLAELGDHAEVSCLWSNPDDSHVVIIKYTGAIRLDLTLDPDDPRFQGFAVGYGTSAEAAEENATRVSARFATYYDGGGYDVLVAESWAAEADAVGRAAASNVRSASGSGGSDQQRTNPGVPRRADVVTPPTSVDPFETCAGKAVGASCWMETSNQPACHVWNWALSSGETVTWSGECAGGYARGMGTVTWEFDGGPLVAEGSLADGKMHGDWALRYANGSVHEGTHIDGERNGEWIVWLGPGNVDRGPYVNGRRHGDWVDWDPGERVYLWPYVDGEWHGVHVACELGERANLVWVNVFENGEQVDAYYDYDDITDPQLARAAAAACARVLSLEQPTRSRNR